MDAELRSASSELKTLAKNLKGGGHDWYDAVSDLYDIILNFQDCIDKSTELRNLTLYYIFLTDLVKKYAVIEDSSQEPQQFQDQPLNKKKGTNEAVIQDGREITKFGLKKQDIRKAAKAQGLRPGEVYRFPVPADIQKNND